MFLAIFVSVIMIEWKGINIDMTNNPKMNLLKRLFECNVNDEYNKPQEKATKYSSFIALLTIYLTTTVCIIGLRVVAV